MQKGNSCMKRLLFFLLLLLFILSGCSNLSESSTSETVFYPLETSNDFPPEQRLRITARYQDGPEGHASFSAEELGYEFGDSLEYINLTDVKIEMNDGIYPLEEAIQSGLISIEEIFAYARLDYRNGFCNQTQKTKNGLTHFTYHYEGIDLCLVYDVFEAPDGQNHLISDMGVYHDGTRVGHLYTDDQTGERIDYEDWGLTFTVVDATPTKVTILCQQSGGQQIGELYLDSDWWLSGAEEMTTSVEDQASPETPLTMGGEFTFTLDWGNKYGVLPSGEYELSLAINDHFDKTQVHSLMKDFQQRQYYSINLDIP